MCSDVEPTAGKTATAFICHAMTAFQHSSVKDEFKADPNRNKSSSSEWFTPSGMSIEGKTPRIPLLHGQ